MQTIIRLAFLILLGISPNLYAENKLNTEIFISLPSEYLGKDKLKSLEDYVDAHEKDSTYIDYTKLLLREATKANNQFYIGNALWKICRYYYLFNSDSLHHYVTLAQPIFMANNRKEELLRMKGWDGFALTYAHKYQEAMNQIEEMRKIGNESSYDKGNYYTDFTLANFYISSGLKEEGMQIYLNMYKALTKGNDNYEKTVYVLRQLLNEESSIEKKIYYCDILKKYIDLCDKTPNKQFDEVNTYNFLLFTYHRIYGQIEFERKNAKELYLHMKTVKKLQEEFYWEKDPSSYQILSFYYAILTDNITQVKQTGDFLLSGFMKTQRMEEYRLTLKLKGSFLAKHGNYEKAFNDYNTYVQLEDSLVNNKHYKALAVIRTQSEVNKLINQNQQMEAKAATTRMFILFLSIVIFLLFILCILLILRAKEKAKNAIKLKEAKERAEESDRLKSAFLANMNHEIRTPLNAIVGFSQILIDEDDKNTRKEFGEIILNNNHLLERIINDILDLSKIESNTISFKYENIEIMGLLKEIYHTMSIRMPDKVTLELTENSPIIIRTDHIRLTQIMTNLIGNAIKYTKEGYIRFGYTRTNTSIEFFVSDTGQGISQENLKSIFDRFMQLDNWEKGVGLGLAISKGLIIHMGGNIRVESKIHEGSIFYITLPI